MEATKRRAVSLFPVGFSTFPSSTFYLFFFFFAGLIVG